MTMTCIPRRREIDPGLALYGHMPERGQSLFRLIIAVILGATIQLYIYNNVVFSFSRFALILDGTRKHVRTWELVTDVNM